MVSTLIEFDFVFDFIMIKMIGSIMTKFLKFSYYNISLGLIIYLILYLYKINIWLTIIGSAILVYLFVKVTSKFLIYANNF
jgi:hypothetical protein